MHVRARKTIPAIAVFAVLALALLNSGIVGQTTANFRDSVFGSAVFMAGEMPLQGWAEGAAIENLRYNVGGEPQQLSPGAITRSDHNSPGRRTASESGYADSSLLGLLFGWTYSAAGTSCAAFVANTPPNCLGTSSESDATATTQRYLIRMGELLSQSDYVRIQGSGSLGAQITCTPNGNTAPQPTGVLQIRNGSGGTSFQNYNLATLNTGTTANPNAGNTNFNHSWGLLSPSSASGTINKIVDPAAGIVRVTIQVQTSATIFGVGGRTVNHTATLLRAECGINDSSGSASLGTFSASNAGTLRSAAEDLDDLVEEAQDSAAEEDEGLTSQRARREEAPLDEDGDAATSELSRDDAVERTLEPEPPSSTVLSAPTRVPLNTPVTLSAQDGTHLGTATVKNVVHAPACATDAPGTRVAIELQLATSPATGESRISGVSERDFGEVRPDGTVAHFRTAVPGCSDATPALPTSTAPSSTYTGWIVFDVSSPHAELAYRPPGTSGLSFLLPPPPSQEAAAPIPTAPTSSVPTPATTTAPEQTAPTAPTAPTAETAATAVPEPATTETSAADTPPTTDVTATLETETREPTEN